jgi:hypothetical protein
MALAIACFVALEVGEWLRPAARQRSFIAIPWIVAVVHMAVKAMWAMKPRSRAEEHAAHEPVRPIVAIGGAVIRCVVKVPVRAHRRYSNTNADSDLGRCNGSSAE